MNRNKQLKMIENYIKKHGVTHCKPDHRGKDSVTEEFDLIRKKARNRRFKLFSKGDS